MANEDVSDALGAFQTILGSIDPTPQPAPNAIYLYPDDFDTETKRAAIDYTDLPLMIVAQRVNQRFQWRPASHGAIFHGWLAEVLALLHPGPVTRLATGVEAEAKQVPWLRAMQMLLYQNQGLNGNCLAIGNENYLFDYQIGHIEWDTKIFWGVHYRIPIIQDHSST